MVQEGDKAQVLAVAVRIDRKQESLGKLTAQDLVSGVEDEGAGRVDTKSPGFRWLAMSPIHVGM
jgi:hypothetical protein